MERQSIVLLAILCNAFFQTAESCLQNLPWYEDQRRDVTRLPDEIQAIVPAYSFSCYGNVTQWGAYVDPHNDQYQVEFQVWRPRYLSEDGNYELVGSNTRSQLVPSNGQVILPVEQQFQIRVEPGDVVGFYANHLNLSRNRNQWRSENTEGGIEVDVDIQSVTVWYTRTSYQEYSPGHELQENDLMSSTLGAPVITAVVVTSVMQVQATSSSSQYTISSSQVLITTNMEVLVSINIPEEESEDMSGGAPQNILIFAAVGGGASLVFVIAAIAGICACVARRRRKVNKTRDLTDGVAFDHIELRGNAAYMAPQNLQRIDTYLIQVPLGNEEQHVQHGSEENVRHLVYDISTPTDDDHVYDYVDGSPYALANAPDTYDTTVGSGYVINRLEYEDMSPISIGLRNDTKTEDGTDSEYMYADQTIGNGTRTEGGTEPEYAEPMVGNETPQRILTPQPYEQPVSITFTETVA